MSLYPRALAVLKWQNYSCALDQPTIYDSALLVEGESLHLSCSVCENCEPKLSECATGFSIQNWLKLSKTSSSGKTVGKVITTDASSIRDRVRARLFVSGKLPNDTLKKEIGLSGSAHNQGRNRTIPPLNIYYTVEKPGRAPEKLTFTKTRFFQPRVYVYKDQLVLRRSQSQDTGIYTCIYRGRPRIVWAVTVLETGMEPYRQTIAPMVYLKANDVDVDPPHKIRTLGNKTVSRSNIKMFTSWGPWSECVPCIAQLPAGSKGFEFVERGGEGFQMRVGTCHIRIVDSFLPLRPYKLAQYATLPLKQYGRSGLPCRSHLIEVGVQNSGIIPLIKRPSEIIIRSCYRPCPPPKSTSLYTFAENSRGLTEESAKDAADDVSSPETKHIHVKDGDSYVISCPIRGTAHSPISWFRLPNDREEVKNLTQAALSPKAFATFGTASGWLAYHVSQLNLTSLLRESRGRIRLDPAYHLIYAEARSDLDCTYEPDDKYQRRPSFRLACVHGDARGSSFKWSDWSGVIAVNALIRWRQLEVLTGLSTATAVLMPAILAFATVVLSVKCLMDERKPKIRAAALGRSKRPKI
ncbi:hypothetical protein Aperf_G00000039789 [Anoplocephala perfoliata]